MEGSDRHCSVQRLNSPELFIHLIRFIVRASNSVDAAVELKLYSTQAYLRVGHCFIEARGALDLSPPRIKIFISLAADPKALSKINALLIDRDHLHHQRFTLE